MEKGGGSKIRQKGRGGSNNVSLSVAEDRGQHNLSTQHQRQSSPGACGTKLLQSQLESKLGSIGSIPLTANNKRIVLLCSEMESSSPG